MKDAVRYKVTVTATIERTGIEGKKWEVVGQEVVGGTDKMKSVYGYTPEIEKTIRSDVQVYEQTVDALDLAALVSVVNGLVGPNAEITGSPKASPS